jgi:hypothetical protein
VSAREAGGGKGGGRWLRRGDEMGEGGKRKGHGSFLNLLMFVSGHVINEHKGVMPHVPCPLMFMGLNTFIGDVLN